MSSAGLSALQQGITVVMAIMGVVVAWRAPKKGTSQEYAVTLVFIILGGVGVYATYIQGERLDAASEKQRLQLDAIQNNTQQAPRVIVENKIDPNAISDAVHRGMETSQTADITKGMTQQVQRSELLLRIKAFTLATDILTFVSEREKNRPKIELLPRANESPSDYKSRSEKEWKDYQDYEANTAKLFQDRYWPRALQVLVELKSGGINVESVWYQPVGDEQLKDFAIGTANVAEKAVTQ